MGPIGVPEMIFIFVLALLIFGPRKLPELGRALGKALGEFRRASTDLRRTVEDEMYEMERQAKELERDAREAVAGTGETRDASAPAASVSAEATAHSTAPHFSDGPDQSAEAEAPSQGDVKPA